MKSDYLRALLMRHWQISHQTFNFTSCFDETNVSAFQTLLNVKFETNLFGHTSDLGLTLIRI